VKLTFPLKPNGTIAELWQAVLDLIPQLERGVIRNVSIGTTETAIAHGMTAAPDVVFWAQQSNVTIWRSSAPDERFVYLTASSACVADLKVS
jgi:hypothetical protein